MHCKEDPIYVIPEMKLRGLVPNGGIGNAAVQFYFWKYLFQIFGTLSLQCGFFPGTAVSYLTTYTNQTLFIHGKRWNSNLHELRYSRSVAALRTGQMSKKTLVPCTFPNYPASQAGICR
jgi:hypothetical protein